MRVLIGMSGGIDSTVAAILLQEQGYELVGATFRTFDLVQNAALSNDKSCCSEDSITEAKKMAQALGIEHHVLDFRATFHEHVVSNFVSEYAAGRTPNPCVMCNSHIKWGELLKAADELGCDYVATGHYAQIAEYRGHYYLKNAVDTHKDQTYFLWMLTEENLRRTLFPLGGLTKTQVRQIAFDHGYEVLSKKSESQDICFIPNNDYRTFLSAQGLDIRPGDYIDCEGKKLGTHCGFCHYTVGQRKGLGIALGSPKHVLRIDAASNTVMLGDHDDLYTHDVYASQVRLRDPEWLLESPEVEARIRYKSPTLPATITTNLSKTNAASDCSSEHDKNTLNFLHCHFSQPVWGVTPGQSLVLYKDGLLIGGGIIE